MMNGMDADAPALSINCRGKLLDLAVPSVMGILNLSHNSFYAPSTVKGEKILLDKAEQQLQEGASMLDIGAMTSKPGSEYISAEAEWKLLEPAIKCLRKQYPEAILSIDTHRKATAEKCLDLGADIINDITGGDGDQDMFELIAKINCPYIIMHMQGTPRNMQENPQYDNVVLEVLDYFIQKLGVLREMGVVDVLLDPGFG
jgi:dihydropteroate synthase